MTTEQTLHPSSSQVQDRAGEPRTAKGTTARLPVFTATHAICVLLGAVVWTWIGWEIYVAWHSVGDLKHYPY